MYLESKKHVNFRICTKKNDREKMRAKTGQIRHCVNGILLPKLFWPSVKRNCSSDREKKMKFEAEGQEFAKFLRLLEQFIQTV